MYKPLYDDKHRYVIISTDPEKREGLEQKGLRERLLCLPCEQKLSVSERYARSVMERLAAKIDVVTHGTLTINGVAYDKFKLFLDSILWRMSVAQSAVFREVSLGKHEEVLRVSIEKQVPLLPSDYPCQIRGVFLNGVYSRDWILPPEQIKVENVTVVRFLINGLLVFYILTRRRLAKDLKLWVVNRQNKLKVKRIEATETPYLYDRIVRVGSAANQRRN